MTSSRFSIKIASSQDAEILGKISGDSFVNDRHTQMKSLGKYPYDHAKSMTADIPRQATSPKYVLLKAIDTASSEITGWVSWGFRGFTEAEIADMRPGIIEKSITASFEDRSEKKEHRPTDRVEANTDTVEDNDPIKRLQSITGADLKDWMDKLMPEGTKCMFVVSLCVAPKWQSQGVGSTLLRWGTERADAAGVFIWVHSSADAWPMYAKHGFETVGTLDVDLDRYAPAPAPDQGGKWGHYEFRYMKRLPRGL